MNKNKEEEIKILHLNLKKEWYDLIKSGKKDEKYREIKPYWTKRLFPFGKYTHVCFHYGYTKKTMIYKIKQMKIGYSNPKLGAPIDKNVFIIKFINI